MEYNMPIKFEYFTCACSTPEHTMRVWLDEEDGEAYIEIYKHTPSFFYRITKAVKYLFQIGDDCNTVTETVLDKQQVQQLKQLLSQI
jgi:uncharacterized Fe-S cluster-containing radical SAM superfamily protein